MGGATWVEHREPNGLARAARAPCHPRAQRRISSRMLQHPPPRAIVILRYSEGSQAAEMRCSAHPAKGKLRRTRRGGSGVACPFAEEYPLAYLSIAARLRQAVGSRQPVPVVQIPVGATPASRSRRSREIWENDNREGAKGAKNGREGELASGRTKSMGGTPMPLKRTARRGTPQWHGRPAHVFPFPQPFLRVRLRVFAPSWSPPPLKQDSTLRVERDAGVAPTGASFR